MSVDDIKTNNKSKEISQPMSTQYYNTAVQLTRSATAVGRLQREVDVLLRVQAYNK